MLPLIVAFLGRAQDHKEQVGERDFWADQEVCADDAFERTWWTLRSAGERKSSREEPIKHMSQFPKDPKKIRERITRYERNLANEKRKFGGVDDSAGKRYLLGPLYMLLGDIDGARKSFAWFQRTFPDDMGEPFQYLCWTLALYRAGNRNNAAKKLAQTWFQNPYLVLRLLGLNEQMPEIRYSVSWQLPEYVEDGPSELFDLWDDDARAWASEIYARPWFKQVREAYLEIEQRLKSEPVGPTRSRLVTERHQLITLDGVETGE